ncbi:MAG: hypothetical protein IJA32_06695 [Lachnospiraceae bacterium]|nr:hypothetical protein [Lachnospiraceae bacterium]
MSDKERRAHELALKTVSAIMSRDLEVMRNSDGDEDEVREVLAASVLEAYNFHYASFLKSIK